MNLRYENRHTTGEVGEMKGEVVWKWLHVQNSRVPLTVSQTKMNKKTTMEIK